MREGPPSSIASFIRTLVLIAVLLSLYLLCMNWSELVARHG